MLNVALGVEGIQKRVEGRTMGGKYAIYRLVEGKPVWKRQAAQSENRIFAAHVAKSSGCATSFVYEDHRVW